ncbi:AGAP005230-PA [Anopheles gambiae str. PEST]|uniref:AGAP005230-PA n=1 Tax=Anopheles gambiae TaxID=7165 RepID=Q7Q9H7_ANOGA|nr:AGAP005230-PA [Anopheles gambiae str. PEST]
MSKAMRTKDRKSMQVCREHKTLQVRFQKQENSLMALQNENKSLHQRVRQYETCLDDIMRKVVDALVAEDSLRDEVAILKGRVRDLEAQNAALVTTHASPAKSRDEGYCTMSSGQPQPPAEGHLEELPEEPEQWLMSAEPCTADMEDWSMSQEELVTALDEENHEWIWNSNFLTSAETQTEEITALLHDQVGERQPVASSSNNSHHSFSFLYLQIVYSEDEEVTCTNFTRDFYRLVSFTSGSTRSLHSPMAAGGTVGERAACDSSDEDDANGSRSQSPTPSEGGRAQVLSCSSSESSDALTEKLQLPASASSMSCSASTTIDEEEEVVLRSKPAPKKGAQSLPESPNRRYMGKQQADAVAINPPLSLNTADLLQDVLITCHNQLNGKAATKQESTAAARSQSPASATWRRSTGWRRVQRGNGVHETHIPVPIGAKDRLKSPPPVPIRRTFAS